MAASGELYYGALYVSVCLSVCLSNRCTECHLTCRIDIKAATHMHHMSRNIFRFTYVTTLIDIPPPSPPPPPLAHSLQRTYDNTTLATTKLNPSQRQWREVP